MGDDLLHLSARYIDENLYEGPRSVNRTSAELCEIVPGIGFVEAFSNVVAFRTEDGLVLFDTSLTTYVEKVLRSLRDWSRAPVHTIGFTHGHIDHVAGAAAFLEEAKAHHRPRPRIVGHENVAGRFHRYELTNGYNAVANRRQFSPTRRIGGAGGLVSGDRFGPADWPFPDTTFRSRMSLRVGDTEIDLRHARGETDDHLWAWLPEHRAVIAGDFVTWVFPNAGNPQKVQRYPAEWAAALREMAALDPELLLPAHGLPIGGRARVRRVLDDLAAALETLVEQSLTLMNSGATLDDLLRTVRVPSELLARPYMRPVYDEPEFVVRNIWRLYGGWYDGNPAHLKPAPASSLAREIAALAGGAGHLATRAGELSATDPRLAAHLAELAVQAEPDSREAHAVRAAVYNARRDQELSLMARGIFGTAAAESERLAVAGDDDVQTSDETGG